MIRTTDAQGLAPNRPTGADQDDSSGSSHRQAALPLNTFQRVMLHWCEVHPYNATHTYKIAGPARPEDLQAALRATYVRDRFGLVELAPDGVSYAYQTDDEPEVEQVVAGPAVEQTVAEHIAAELNRPFVRPRCRPLRFSVVDAGPDFHYVNTTYDHWTADSIAVRLILRRVLGRYCGLEIPENDRPLQLHAPTYRATFGHLLGPLRLAGVCARSIGLWLRRRAVAQPAYASMTQLGVGHRLYHAAPGTVEQLRDFARSLGASVHDVVLAALGRAMAEFLPRRSQGKGRHQALGTIVDTRGDSRVDLDETLGTFLGYYTVRCQPERAASLADLTRRIAAMTGPIKTRRKFIDSVVNMKLATLIWPRLRECDKPFFMRRVLPMTAGVSNVLLRDTWIERFGQGLILDCMRGAPTGTMLPLVITPTTLGQHMNVGVSYRTTCFSADKVDGVMRAFLEQVENPTGRSSATRGAPQPTADSGAR